MTKRFNRTTAVPTFLFPLIAALAPTAAGSEPGFPARIVTIAPNAAEILCALGVCDRIVGVDKFCVHPPELLDRPRVGGLFDPDLERIIALRPDLVIVRGRSDAVEKLCADRGINFYRDRTERLGDIETTLLELASLTGRASQGEQLRTQFRNRLDAVRKRVEGLPKPRVLLTVSRRPGRLSDLLTAAKGSFLDDMLTLAGGHNVFGSLDIAYPQVGPEGILGRRPEIIIEFMPELDSDPAIRDRLASDWRELAAIPAVATGRIVFIIEPHALIPSLRCAEIVEKLADLLHPKAEPKP